MEDKYKYQRKYYQKNKERVKEWKRDYRAKNREKINEYKRKYRAIHREQETLANRRITLKGYGISLQEYDKLCELQNNVCAICLKRKGEEMLIVDHDHKTGKVRGLLCSDCNKGLGFFKDNGELLEKARNYLRS